MAQKDTGLQKWGWFIVFLLSLVPLVSLLKPGLFWAHDSEAHLVRIISFYQSLTEGNIFPRWSQTLNAGYGHPIFMFLYPLPNYLASLFHALGFTVATSIKLVLSLGFVGSGLLMYAWLKQHVTAAAAVVGALVWQFAPYRFVNVYVRNALGENTAFLFIPLTLLAFYKLIRHPGYGRVVAAALSLAGILFSHNAVSLMFLPFLVLYEGILLFNQKGKRRSAIGYVLVAMVLGFSLSAVFTMPAYLEGKYTLRETVMRGDTFTLHFPTLRQLVVPSWGYDNSIPGNKDDLSFQIGLVQWLAFLVGGGMLLKRIKRRWDNLTQLYVLALVTFAVGAFLLLEISLPVWHLFPIIKKFQFPWRLLIMPVLASSILAAVSTRQTKRLKCAVVLITGLLLLIQNYRYWRPRGDYLPDERQVAAEYLGTTDTGESTPLWAIRFQEKRPDFTLGVVHGAPIEYEIKKRESEVHEQTITAKVDTQVSENTLYFPGWTAYVDGQRVPITFEDQNWRGVITYPVPQGTHNVKIIFKETRLRQVADAMTIASFVFVLGLLIYDQARRKRRAA